MSSPSPPPKRSPGRPRKAPAERVSPKEALAEALVAEEAPDGEATPHPAPKHAKPEPAPKFVNDEADDSRIGQDVDPTVTQVGFDDGRVYRCDAGRVVERIA